MRTRTDPPAPPAMPPAPPPDILAEVIEALSEGLAIFDENAELLHSNAEFARLNPRLSDIIAPGLPWEIFLREAVARGAMSPVAHERLRWAEARLGEGDASAPPAELEGPGGTLHEVALRATSAGGFVLTQCDLTDRRRFEDGAREADVLLRKVLEACPANVIMSRVGDGQVIYRSPAATELLGTARRTQQHFASREQRADFITALLPEGRVDGMAVTGLRADGSPFPCLVSARLIDYRGEDVIVSTMLDVSKEVALRRALADQREQIFQAEKMSALGELLAGVAHELNNPLSVVVGHALMLREEVTDPEVLRRIEKISDAAERCTRIVKSFLAMARQEPVRLAPMDMRETAEGAVEALRQAGAGPGTPIEIAIPDGLPAVQGDAHQIAQVVINLVMNADQAIRASGLGDLIRLTARHDAAAGMLELRVADNGPGVPEALRGRIFDPLFTTKDVGQGTGIGLAFCHRVATAHAGRIALEQDGQRGACFVLRLPVAQSAAPPDDAGSETGAGAVSGRILVVDDEPEVAELIREILRRDGFSVDSAESAEAALSLVRSHPYTLVLTDLNMPGIGGRGFYEALQRDVPRLAARVGFVTGDTMSPQARSFLDAARRPYLEKPIAPAELRRLARAMLDAASGGAEGAP